MITFRNINFKAYRPGKSSLKRDGKVIKLSANESAIGASPKAIAAYENDKNKIAKILTIFKQGPPDFSW